jgi:formylglycine-generating enzyme required for sulfatase activity
MYDLIGNAWEWTSEDVIDGMWNGRTLPQSGYVRQVDQSGVAVVSDAVPQEGFYGDYFWSKPTGAFGMMRGGFYGSQSDAGVYTLHAETLPTTAGAAISFRCVQ